MLTETNYKPILERDWGKTNVNYHPISTFNAALEMSEESFYIWANNNGQMAGDVDMKIFREISGKFLNTNILALCHGLSSQRFRIRPSVVVVGSAAYSTLARQKDEFGWIYEMTSLDRKGPIENEVKDLDIWIPRITMLHLSKIGIDFNQTRSNSEVVMATVRTKGVKIQIHALQNHDLNPLMASAFLANTDIMATAIVFDGPEAYFTDPFAALQNGPWNQEFPYRLFDENNFLLRNQPKIVISSMIWAITTPFFPESGIVNQNKIRSKVSNIIDAMDYKSLQAMGEKYMSQSVNSPYSDELFEQSTAFVVARLAKLGVLPALLKNAEKYDLKDLKQTLQHSIGTFIANMNEIGNKVVSSLPRITHHECDEAILTKDYSKINNLIEKVNWEKIIDMNLPRPF